MSTEAKIKFNPLEHPVCLEFPLWLEETAWGEHIPFAMFMISALRPRVLVELGAYRGVSLLRFLSNREISENRNKMLRR